MNRIITNQVSISKGGVTSALYLTLDSGKIIYRDKVDTLIGIKHPGIVLGTDSWGTIWVIHNHYKLGQPQIVTIDDFAIGNSIFYDSRPIFYSTLEIIERAINHYLEGKEYNWLYNNCQHFVNKVAQNNSSSETIYRVSENALFIGGLASFIGLATKNQTLLKTGLTIAGVGVTGKFLNK